MFIEVAYAAEAAAESGGSTISVVPSLAEIWPSLLAFLVLFLILKKFAFTPIGNMLDKRTATIKESLERAEETKVEAERLLEEYRVQMAEARAEAGKVIEQGRKVAESMREEIVAKAHEEAAQIVAGAREAIVVEKKAAIAELQTSVAELSVAVAGKLIGEKLSAAEHGALIDRYLAEVGSLDDRK